MKSVRSESGSVILPTALAVVAALLIIAIGFAVWAYNGRQYYKNNTDQKIAAAVADAKTAESSIKDQQFAEESKSPLKTYAGPEAYGSIRLQYPKTWSGYVSSDNSGSPYIDGYFAPGVVPDSQGENSVFALRLQVSGDSYSTVMQEYQSLVQSHLAKVAPYKLPKVPGVVGSKITGQLQDGKQGTLILLPLRADTLQIWTESSRFLSDLNKYILPNLSFSP